MNCLSYALNYWYYNRDTIIYYNSNHCINVEEEFKHYLKQMYYLPLEDFGYEHMYESFKGLLKKKDIKMLKEYFKK
jgi:hypothetical protein